MADGEPDHRWTPLVDAMINRAEGQTQPGRVSPFFSGASAGWRAGCPAQSDQVVAEDLIPLYKALGGGWDLG